LPDDDMNFPGVGMEIIKEQVGARLESVDHQIRLRAACEHLLQVQLGAFEIENEGSDPVEFESTELHLEKVLAGGAKSYLVINGLKPGTYLFFDDFHPNTGKVHVVVR